MSKVKIQLEVKDVPDAFLTEEVTKALIKHIEAKAVDFYLELQRSEELKEKVPDIREEYLNTTAAHQAACVEKEILKSFGLASGEKIVRTHWDSAEQKLKREEIKTRDFYEERNFKDSTKYLVADFIKRKKWSEEELENMKHSKILALTKTATKNILKEDKLALTEDTGEVVYEVEKKEEEYFVTQEEIETHLVTWNEALAKAKHVKENRLLAQYQEEPKEQNYGSLDPNKPLMISKQVSN